MQSMTETKNSNNPKRRPRPAQMLYVPPAQRNRRSIGEVVYEEKHQKHNNMNATEVVINEDTPPNINTTDLAPTEKIDKDSLPEERFERMSIVEREEEKDDEKSLVIMLESIKTAPDKSDIDVEREEMQRAIVNINRKSRPLIKHVNVGKNDVLHIDVNEKECKKPAANKVKVTANLNIDSWEDLLNEDDEDFNGDFQDEAFISDDKNGEDFDDDEDNTGNVRDRGQHDLDHVIEVYDFPTSFKSQDIMQLYHDVHKDTYLRWCDDTHALLVFSTPMIAQKALQIHHDIIKSRPMGEASSVAAQTAAKSDLKPAMKRPPTTMQTARRLITTHLGTKSRISKEEQEKERELLRQAKALKLAQKQSEKDAWEGNPRPSTA